MMSTLICTVGTSLLKPNLSSLPEDPGDQAWMMRQPAADRDALRPERLGVLSQATRKGDPRAIASALSAFPPSVRLCGAEINSVGDLIDHGFVSRDCRLCFCYSDTDEGRLVADILGAYFQQRGHVVELLRITDLQDRDAKRFRTKGLRHLTKEICRLVLAFGAAHCAINATGGYKAQIAIAVMMGQALSVPVYYKHELFSEIIAFPPMPISLDHDLWLRFSGVLSALDRSTDLVSEAELPNDEWDEALETLINRVRIDGEVFLELSPTGQVFHESFRGRFESERDQLLPPPFRGDKGRAALNDHSWGNAREAIVGFMQRILDEVPYVRGCNHHYWNKELGRTPLFRLTGDQVEAVFSNGSWTVKVIVETTANTEGQRAACVADLNRRLPRWL